MAGIHFYIFRCVIMLCNMAEKTNKNSIHFFKGGRDILANIDSKEDDEKSIIKKEILQVFDVKNLSFLIGAGCSSFTKDSQEIGIPIMSILAKEFYEKVLTGDDKKFILETLKIDITTEPLSKNLEKLMEVLYSHLFVLESQKADLTDMNLLVDKVTSFLLSKCINEKNNTEFSDVTDLYSLFYRKLIYRDSNLTKTNIFTTNYDLYSETALDKLGILYTNGFSGFVERYFNPVVFNYAYAEQMELSNSKWSVIDNFIYLYKIHGSVNWVESADDKHLFKVKELQKADESAQTVMVYPTPMKQVASFASPYSDLFREFQKRLMQDKNVLVVMGYSFSDEHINNIIYQALTIPNFRLIIFQDSKVEAIEKLISLNDPRIWVIGGQDDNKPKTDGQNRVHYFNYIVNELLPDIDQEKIEESVDKVIRNLLKKQ